MTIGVQAEAVVAQCPVLLADRAYTDAVNTPQYHWSERVYINHSIDIARQKLVRAVFAASKTCLEVTNFADCTDLQTQKINCPVLKTRLGLSKE